MPAAAAGSGAPAAAAVDPTLNPAVAALRPSKTMALTDAARAMRERGVDVIGLAAGEPDFDTPAPIVEAGVEALRTGQTRYTPNAGTAALRRAIAAKLEGERRAHEASAFFPSVFFFACGGAGGLFGRPESAANGPERTASRSRASAASRSACGGAVGRGHPGTRPRVDSGQSRRGGGLRARAPPRARRRPQTRRPPSAGERPRRPCACPLFPPHRTPPPPAPAPFPPLARPRAVRTARSPSTRAVDSADTRSHKTQPPWPRRRGLPPPRKKKQKNNPTVDNNLRYDPDTEIVVSNGAKQAIWQALLATVSPGDEVIIPAPYWVSYPEMARLAGARAGGGETTARDGWVLSAERLRAALTPRSRLLILCTPSNPTGAVYTEAQLRAIADVVRDHPRLLVLSDEIYESIVYAPAAHVSFAALGGGAFGRTLTVNGFSKSFAMTGWRLGYLAAPAHFARAAAAIQSQSTSGASSIAQHAAVAALAMGPRGGPLVAAMVAEFERRRDLVAAALEAIPGVALPAGAPQGAFYALPDVSALVGPGAEAEGYGPVPDADALADYLLREARVASVPGSAFGAPACLRLSYAASEATLREALGRVARALEAPRYRRP